MQSDELMDGDGTTVNDEPRYASVNNVKPKVKTVRSLTNEEYEAIFDAVLARYPPMDSQGSGERIIKKEDDTENEEINQINDNADAEELMGPENDISRAELVQVTNETTPCVSDTEHTDNDNVSRTPPKVRQKKKGLYSKRRKLSPSAFTFSKIPIEKLDGVEDDVSTIRKKEKRVACKVEKRKHQNPEFSKPQKMSRKSKKQTYKHTASVDRNTCGKVNLSKKEKMLERKIDEKGTWVQCGKMSCLKWRYLPDVHDPSLLPNLWTCTMNPDSARNNCSKPEEDYDESKHVFTRFTEGSIVWARMAGYPWWPAMVEIDPDYDIFYECRGFENVATHYHVVFFDDKVSRAWLGVNSLNSFEAEHNQFEIQKTISQGIEYKRRINDALVQAKEALKLSIPERLKTFTFGKRFSGRWGKEKRRHEIGNKPVRRSVGQMSKEPTIQPKPTEETEVESQDDLDELLDDVLMKSAEGVLEDLQFLSSPEGMDLIESSDNDYDPEAECIKREPTIYGTGKAEKRKKHKKRKNRPFEDVKKKASKKQTSLDEIPTGETKKKHSKKDNSDKRNKKEKSDKPKQMTKAASENSQSKKPVVSKNKFAAPERNIHEKKEKLEGKGNGSKPEQKGMKRPVFKPQKPSEKPRWEPVKKEELKLDPDVFTMELDSQQPSGELLSSSTDKLKSKVGTVEKTSAKACEKLEKNAKLPSFKAPSKKAESVEKNPKENMPFKPPVSVQVPAAAIDKTSIEMISASNVESSEQDDELVIDMDGDKEAQDYINNVEEGNLDSDDSEPFELEEPVIATLNKLGESQDFPLFDLEQ